MTDDRKTVKLPPDLWRLLKDMSYQQDTPIVRLIERWAQNEKAAALQEEKSRQEFSAA